MRNKRTNFLNLKVTALKIKQGSKNPFRNRQESIKKHKEKFQKISFKK